MSLRSRMNALEEAVRRSGQGALADAFNRYRRSGQLPSAPGLAAAVLDLEADVDGMLEAIELVTAAPAPESAGEVDWGG
jgi:hypothetical protein